MPSRSASRGASVVVNDLGSSLDGAGSDSSIAELVASELVELGGSAVGDTNSVTTSRGGQAIVATALDAFGRIDVVVNNAGIIQDKTFHNMNQESFDLVISVHLTGAFNVVRAAWPHLREQGYGRVINTTSAAGIFGNFGQANYAAAKAGIVGLTKVLAIEGAKYGITSHAIAPIARTRMTEHVLSSSLIDRLAPELVSPLVVWLASEECTESGGIYTVGGGRVACFVVALSPGWTSQDGLDPEAIRDHWDLITNTDDVTVVHELNDDFRALRRALA